MKFISDILKNKKGVTTVYVILVVSALLPLILFLSIDVPHYLDSSRKIKNTLDNASSSAITFLNDQKISEGVLEVDKQVAEAMIKKIIKNDLSLDDNYNPLKGSIISKKPIIKTYVINNPKGIETVSTPIDNVKVNNTSVVIYAEVPVKGLFFTFNEVTMRKVAVSQARF
ncbi:cobalt ABC transporter permease [Bacillus thuringiensis]|uniref:cobalt ABC transporter permease n=1 Tax=Bacillus thuringiensis TaxID=1428 RepID=UPI0011A3EADC|nr:cobalt ABC transporter permease [Bacillus thuringiensis]